MFFLIHFCSVQNVNSRTRRLREEKSWWDLWEHVTLCTSQEETSCGNCSRIIGQNNWEIKIIISIVNGDISMSWSLRVIKTCPTILHTSLLNTGFKMGSELSKITINIIRQTLLNIILLFSETMERGWTDCQTPWRKSTKKKPEAKARKIWFFSSWSSFWEITWSKEASFAKEIERSCR